MLRPLSVLYNLYALLVFVAIMLLLFPFFLVASWGGPLKGANGMMRICSLWADAWMLLVGMRHRNHYEVPHDPDRAYIFVANHLSYIDAVLLVKSIRQRFRPLGRAETSSLPVFGYIYRKAIVTVDRTDAANRAASVNRLKALVRKGISVFVFPEGTFNMTTAPLASFYDGAFRVAIESGTPIKPVLFLDGFHRMHYGSLLSLTPGKSRAVFLEEISVQGYGPDQVKELKEKVHAIMRQKLIDYNAAWI